jgi:hypothetical protein
MRLTFADRWPAAETYRGKPSGHGSRDSPNARCRRGTTASMTVGRDVVELCEVPHGRAGRPSKSLTLEIRREGC